MNHPYANYCSKILLTFCKFWGQTYRVCCSANHQCQPTFLIIFTENHRLEAPRINLKLFTDIKGRWIGRLLKVVYFFLWTKVGKLTERQLKILREYSLKICHQILWFTKSAMGREVRNWIYSTRSITILAWSVPTSLSKSI